jgi:FkbM family methyltransferase
MSQSRWPSAVYPSQLRTFRRDTDEKTSRRDDSFATKRNSIDKHPLCRTPFGRKIRAMEKTSFLQFSHRVSRKILNIQIQAFNKAFNASTKRSFDGSDTALILPLCVSTGFGNVSWKQSWKTHVIGRLARADGGTFLDVGVNVGQTLLDVYVTHPAIRYIGFEPNISNVFFLREMIRANSLNSFLIIPAGLADENRCVALYRGKGNTEDVSATIRQNLRPARKSEVEFIPCFKFDDLRRGLDIKEISFIKMDIEGAELEALTGMKESLQQSRPTVLCEVLFADEHADLAQHEQRNRHLFQYLTEVNYQVFQLIKSRSQEEVVDAKKIDKFVSAYWTAENEDLCDYLFVPAEKAASTVKTLIPTK